MMAATSLASPAQFISVDEYLNTTYRPDVDYVDGQIEVRNLGETDHSKTQGQIYFMLRLHEEEWHLLPLPEVRVQVSPTRFRVPDVCVVPEDGADEPIVKLPPLLCLEVLSPRDSVSAIRQRAQDFLQMGVPEVWVFDPRTWSAYICKRDSMTEHQDGILRLEGSPIELSVAEVFKPLKRKAL